MFPFDDLDEETFPEDLVEDTAEPSLNDVLRLLPTVELLFAEEERVEAEAVLLLDATAEFEER